MRLSRIMITLALSSTKSMIISVDAVFTNASISRKMIEAIITPPVSSTLTHGVLNLGLTRASASGNNLSLLIAIGDREAASIPPLAVVINAAIAAILRIANPHLPMNLPAATDIGA